MKKIVIVTFHRAENYGAQLQCYALQHALKKDSNNSVQILDYRNNRIEEPYKLFNFKLNNLKKSVKSFLKFCLLGKKIKLRKKQFQKFINENLNLTKSVYNVGEIENGFNGMIDICITGSDQVWSKKIVGEISDVYSLNFNINDVKKISYAASLGDATEVAKNKEEYMKIKNIDNISVREEDAKRELEKIIDNEIAVVLDPTLLLDRGEWDKIIDTNECEKEKYILAYVVEKDDEYIKIVNDLSQKTGLKIIHFGLKNPGYNNVLKSEYVKGPLDFIKYIKNAEYVVSTSFHATVFSVIFNKKFFIIPHRKTGARVTNLLNKLGIENRVYNTLEEFEKIDYNFETDWKSVNRKLEEEREKSIKWLENAINS